MEGGGGWWLFLVSLLISVTYRHPEDQDHCPAIRSPDAADLGIDVVLYTCLPNTSHVLKENMLIGHNFNVKSNFDPSKVTKVLIHGFNMDLGYAELFVKGNNLRFNPSIA